jgi:hypothetical protein
MALNTVSSVSIDSGADLGFLKDQNIMTLTGIAAGAATLGGVAIVGAIAAPGYALTGTILTGMAAGGGHLYKTTGSCFPFLGDKKDKDATPVVTDTPVTA